MAEPIEASADQIRRFVDVVGTNAHPLQPTNGRMLVGSGPSSVAAH